ncbi:MAG: hypothetical protein RIR12_1007 [Bacteroidota bacterium]|jgi:hypothetical protein
MKTLSIIFIFCGALLTSCFAPQRTVFKQKIEKTLAEQDSVTSFANKVITKKDSLYKEGNTTEVAFKEYTNSLRTLQLQGSETTEKLKFQLSRVNSRTAFKDYYEDISAYTSQFVKQAESEILQKKELLVIIDKKLDESDLSGEKGRLNGMLNNADAQQAKETVILTGIDADKAALVSAGNLNAATATAVDNRLSLYQKRMDSVGNEIKTLREQLNNPTAVKKNFSIIRSKIILVDSIVNKNAASREYKFSMISEGLKYAKPNLFNLAAFFGPGGYKIPAEKKSTAENLFAPVIDSLILFSNKYESILRTATLMVEGYADASGISASSTLAKKISQYLGEATAEREQLNGGLSAMRADEISFLLNQIVKSRYADFSSINKIVFENIFQGKGEALPNPNIKNYAVNDERRRVVIIYWNVLPVE